MNATAEKFRSSSKFIRYYTLQMCGITIKQLSYITLWFWYSGYNCDLKFKISLQFCRNKWLQLTPENDSTTEQLYTPYMVTTPVTSQVVEIDRDRAGGFIDLRPFHETINGSDSEPP